MSVVITLVQVYSKSITYSVFLRGHYVSYCRQANRFLIHAWFRKEFLNGQKRKPVGFFYLKVCFRNALS